ncbi:MAG: hypothetical protein EBR82_44205 [Caulobacteraceae bacterium]|nr:hypothetical protein [Caulobacteraceae bacterium]
MLEIIKKQASVMETPRTNENAGYYYGHGIKKNSDLVIDPNGPFVLADFARELERENRVMRSLLLRIHSARIGMDHPAVIEALNDLDAFFREPNCN